MRRLIVRAAALAACLAVPASLAQAQAQIVIVNGNRPGVGFNDPTPAVPVGGNTGTTVGEQRLIAFQRAADIWGQTLASATPISVLATFEPQTCTATGGCWDPRAPSASSRISARSACTPALSLETPGITRRWPTSGPAAISNPGSSRHPRALQQQPERQPGVPRPRSGWYYGLDTNHGTNIDLVTVLLHEFAHGLGFSQFASTTSGAQILGLPDVYNRQLFDRTVNRTWPEMTDAERVASAINSRRVVWEGFEVSNAVPAVLSLGTPLLRVLGPASLAGVYAVGAAAFGPPLASPGVTGSVVLSVDPADAAGPSTSDACSPLTNAAAVAGQIALVDRGTCGFAVKVKNAQNAGAVAVIVADNVAGTPPAGLGGADPTIVISSVRISLPDGNAIKAQLASGVNAQLGVDLTVRAGADELGRALMNAPNPVQPGSSISHWDPIASRNQLMEPAINADLTHSVVPPQDLSLPLMRDVGWFPDGDVDGLEDALDRCSASVLAPTVVIPPTDTGVPNLQFTNGCTLQDLINECAVGAKNHGKFVSCVSHLTNDLKKQGVLTSAQRSAIVKAAARSDIGKKHKDRKDDDDDDDEEDHKDKDHKDDGKEPKKK